MICWGYQYELMNYPLLNLKDTLCVPSKDKREVGLHKSFIWKVIATVVVCIDKYQVMYFVFICYSHQIYPSRW